MAGIDVMMVFIWFLFGLLCLLEILYFALVFREMRRSFRVYCAAHEKELGREP